MASIDTIGGGNIEPRGLEEEMRSAYLDYAMSVIVGRALPDVRDGLKPVHRRILYAMNELGLRPPRRHVKCATIVGEVMGKYHPHGDSAIYDTLARMAQDFSMRYPLIDGHGNFGNIDGWGAAAMRYTEARLDPLATEMLRDIDQETVDFAPNFDGSKQEPLVLPARFPNLLVNGGSGIAVGMATNIPPHNLREVVAATIAYIEDPAIDVEGLMKHVKGPDFPTSGTILGREGIRDAYATGRGRIRVQAKAHIEPIGQGKEAIIVTELPFLVRRGGDGGVIEKIATLVHEKKLSEISDIRDESDRNGMRIVIELKRDAIPKVVLNKLFKHTPMQQTFGVNMVALVDNVPRTLSLREVIGHYVDHQREVIVRRTKYELRRAEERAHVLEGLLIALANLDEVIALIRGSQTPEVARHGLVERFELTVVQAQAILQLTLEPADSARGGQDQAGAHGPDRADQGAARDPRRREQGHGPDQGRAVGDRRDLRRRAAHRDRPRRWRDRHRGPDRRSADGHLDHSLGLHQVAAALDLSPAAAGRRRGDRHGDEGGRLHRAPVRLLDA